jgi:hypothetical protein
MVDDSKDEAEQDAREQAEEQHDGHDLEVSRVACAGAH